MLFRSCAKDVEQLTLKERFDLCIIDLELPDKHFPTLFPNGRRHRLGHHITNGRMAQLPGSFEQPGKKPKE